MLQCCECEHYQADALGNARLRCNPFSNIKEPECLVKWQLLRLEAVSQQMHTMVQAYQATVAFYQRLAPLQEKMFRHMQREIDDAEEADGWKIGSTDDSDEDSDDKRDDDSDDDSPYGRS